MPRLGVVFVVSSIGLYCGQCGEHWEFYNADEFRV